MLLLRAQPAMAATRRRRRRRAPPPPQLLLLLLSFLVGSIHAFVPCPSASCAAASAGSSSPRSHRTRRRLHDEEEGGEAILSLALSKQKTLSRYVEVETWKNRELTDLQPVMSGIESACRGIATLVRRAQCDEIAGLHGSGGDTNVQGEVQKVMDVLANNILAASMCAPGKMDYVASEEEEEPTYCSAVLQNAAFQGEYAGVFDPLDGSSNIEAGLPVGTIFGIYRRPTLSPRGTERDPLEAIMQPGRQLLASGYCLYGGQTILVLTLGHGVHGFTLAKPGGDFILTHPNMRIPTRGVMYAINEGPSLQWEPRVAEYVRRLKVGEGPGNQPHRTAYVGAMVADVHRVLVEGGVYAYPGTPQSPNGKIRLLYEANPMSMLIEQAGGLSTTGTERILDIKPTGIHQRVPIFIGSKDDIKDLQALLKE